MNRRTEAFLEAEIAAARTEIDKLRREERYIRVQIEDEFRSLQQDARDLYRLRQGGVIPSVSRRDLSRAYMSYYAHFYHRNDGEGCKIRFREWLEQHGVGKARELPEEGRIELLAWFKTEMAK